MIFKYQFYPSPHSPQRTLSLSRQSQSNAGDNFFFDAFDDFPFYDSLPNFEPESSPEEIPPFESKASPEFPSPSGLRRRRSFSQQNKTPAEPKFDKFVEGLDFPTTKQAQVIADYIFSLFVSEEVDKVEILYTKFVSFLKSVPVIQGLLPLSAKGEIRDVNGNCIEAIGDDFFRMTSKDGKFSVERDKVNSNKKGFLPNMEFEQDPVQILDALMPLYLNNQILRALQESLASELASRMNAMKSASDNASDLQKSLSNNY